MQCSTSTGLTSTYGGGGAQHIQAYQFDENPIVDATHAETQEGPCSAFMPHTLRPHDAIMASTLACVVFWYFAASAPVHAPEADDSRERRAGVASVAVDEFEVPHALVIVVGSTLLTIWALGVIRG